MRLRNFKSFVFVPGTILIVVRNPNFQLCIIPRIFPTVGIIIIVPIIEMPGRAGDDRRLNNGRADGRNAALRFLFVTGGAEVHRPVVAQ